MTSLNYIYMTRLVDLMALSNFSNKQIFLMVNHWLIENMQGCWIQLLLHGEFLCFCFNVSNFSTPNYFIVKVV